MSDAPNRSRAHSEPLPPSPAAGSTSPVKVQAPPLAAVGPSLSQKWFPFLASSPATTTSSSPTAAAQFAVPAGSSRDSGREKVTETIQEASESEEGSSPTRMVMKAPQRPLKNRAPRPLDIQTSPNSETPSETKSHLSESLTSRSPTRKSPLTAAVVPDEARTPQAPDCVCHEVVNESDPKSCKKCCGYLPCIGRLETQIQQSAHDLDKAKRRMDVLTIRAEQAEETSRSFKQQTDTLSQEIQRKEAEIQVMRTDLDTIGEKLVDELERRAELQHSKDAVQEELEELTRSLFEEANSMVASEARERHRFEEREVSLKKQMEQMKLQLTMEQAQLRELKLRMEQVTLENAQLKKGQRPVLAKSPTSGSLPLTHQHQSNIEALYTAAIDSLDLNELSLFDEFIDTSPNTKLNKLHSIPFLKLCLDEDVAPCLRFSAAPKIQGRKLVEPILLNACYVEELSAGQLKGLNERDEKWEEQNSGAKLGVIGDDGARQAISPNPEDSHLDESGSGKSVFSRLSNALNSTMASMASAQSGSNLVDSLAPGCSACGKTSEPYRYQFKLADVTSDIWYPICSLCRSRLVSVCNFYNFIRHIRQGLYSTRRRQDLYLEVLRLKRGMFYSRLGAPGFEALEFASGGTSSGINGAGGVKPNDAFVSSTAVGDTYLRGGSRSGSVVSAMSVSGASVPESRTNGQSPATDP